METIEKAKEIEKLIPKKVTLKASRKHGWLPENHDGAFRFTNTAEHLTIQRDRYTKLLNTGLTPEDESRLEKALGLEKGKLSKYSDYWDTFKIVIPKDGVVLQPASSPTDEVAWRVMCAHQEVANTLSDKRTGFERYVMHSEEEEAENINKEINIKLEAYKK